MRISTNNANIRTTEQRQSVEEAVLFVFEENGGNGLSANHVEVRSEKQPFVWNQFVIRMFFWKHNEHSQGIWNPILKYVSGLSTVSDRNISVPGVSAAVERGISCVLEGEGVNGLPLKYIGDEALTRIWQREIDSLDGILILDYSQE